MPESDPHIPSSTPVYPGHDWHERETFDFFGIIFDGHPGLARIEMPDDWVGHPQRKDYPLGGIPVEYKGARDRPARPAEVVQLMADSRMHATGAPLPDDEDAHDLRGRRRRLVGHRRGGRPPRRGAHRRQHGPPAPVDPRRAAPDARDRRRDGDRGPRGHRLPAHRHREEHGVPDLDAGRDVLHPDGLRRAVLHRGGLLPGRREAPRHHRRRARARPGDPGPAARAQPHHLAPHRDRHRRQRARRHDDHDRSRSPRARRSSRSSS